MLVGKIQRFSAGIIQRRHRHPTLTIAQRCLERFLQPSPCLGGQPKPILHHLGHLRLQALEPNKALLLQPPPHFSIGPMGRDGNLKADFDARVCLPSCIDLLNHGIEGVALHHILTLGTHQGRHARIEQLKVIGELGEGAYGRARSPHAVALFNGNGGRNTVQLVHRRLVHAFEKLARIGRKGFNIPPLTFCIDGIKGQARLTGTADPSDHHHLA